MFIPNLTLLCNMILKSNHVLHPHPLSQLVCHCQACIEPVLYSWTVMYSVIRYSINLR